MNTTTNPKKAPRAVGKATARRRLLSRAAGFLQIARDLLNGASELEGDPEPVNDARQAVRAALLALVTARNKTQPRAGLKPPPH